VPPLSVSVFPKLLLSTWEEALALHQLEEHFLGQPPLPEPLLHSQPPRVRVPQIFLDLRVLPVLHFFLDLPKESHYYSSHVHRHDPGRLPVLAQVREREQPLLSD
jgi:hypothetical protein